MIAAPGPITVRVLKYDGSEYRRWRALAARWEGSTIILDAEFEYDVQHPSLGNIQRGTRTVEYYWLDRWYNVFQFLNDNNQARLFYCNINTPPTFADDELSYIDLDIDVLVQPDLSYEVLDLEEFQANVVRFGYSVEVQSRARAAVDELISMVRTRQFPFDGAG